MKLIIYLSFVAFANFVNSVAAHNQIRASYMETCDKTLRCDSKASLICIDSNCVCLKQDEMIYDSLEKKCVVLAGERCSYTAIERLTDDTLEKRWTEKLDCVKNATCNNDGYCACSRDAYETKQGLCKRKHGHGESCLMDTDCASFEGNDIYGHHYNYNLTCVNQTCSCDETDAVFEDGRCAARAGTPHNKYGRCVRNAYKEGMYELCKCGGVHFQSTNGLCIGKWVGSACHLPFSPCKEGLACIDKNCACPFPILQKPSVPSAEHCISLVNGPCSETYQGRLMTFECEDNAECKNNDGISECVCKKGYIKSKSNLCKKSFGSTCWRSDECDQVDGARLQCYNGFCSCGDLETYDQLQTKCQGLVGAPCSLNKEGYCVSGAFCESSRNTVGYGHCRCRKPAMSDSTRRCRLPNTENVAMGVEMAPRNVTIF